jgi:hypothetical protein
MVPVPERFKRVLPLKKIVDTSFVEEAAKALGP